MRSPERKSGRWRPVSALTTPMAVTREIEPLGDHLGADHDVGLAALDLA